MQLENSFAFATGTLLASTPVALASLVLAVRCFRVRVLEGVAGSSVFLLLYFAVLGGGEKTALHPLI